MVEVTLYMRKDCHLCEIAQSQLEDLQTKVPHKMKLVDVDTDVKLRNLYGFNVPVVQIGPYKLSAPIDKKDLEISLLAVQHSQSQEEKIDAQIKESQSRVPITWTKSDGFSYWLSRHYLLIFNVLAFIYVGLPFLAPVFMKYGPQAPARLIYKAYSFVCHQFAFRSWFLFGEQYAYPRLEAKVASLISYQQATGLDGNDLFVARDFEGNAQVGYKVALCERDVAIYGGILIFGISFALFKRRIKPIHWLLWILLGIVPIGLDGFSQLISQLPLHILPYRESTPLLRTLTGLLFGFVTAWFGYPYVEASMKENSQYLQEKLSQANKWLSLKRSGSEQ